MSIVNQQQNGGGGGELLLDQVRRVMRVRRYSIHTERSYVDWIRRYVKFHNMKSRDDLQGGEAKIEAFLTDLAISKHVAAATQNQAMNALVFLYKQVLDQPLNENACPAAGGAWSDASFG